MKFKSIIQGLIRDAQRKLSQSTRSDFTIENIVNHTIELDYKNEVTNLDLVFNGLDLDENSLKSCFKSLCAKREKQNQHSLLSFTAMPESDCNQLYWIIATLLFRTDSVKTLFNILLPSVCSELIVDQDDFVDGSSEGESQLRSSIIVNKCDSLNHIDIETQDVDEFETEIEKQMTECNVDEDAAVNAHLVIKLIKSRAKTVLSKVLVTQDGLLLNLNSVVNLSFDQHCQLYEILQSQYPQLSAKLYIHNSDLYELRLYIDMLHRRLPTPRQEIEALIRQLKCSDEPITSSSLHHCGRINEVIEAFNAYLKLLPEKAQESIRKLSRPYSYENVEQILSNLEKQSRHRSARMSLPMCEYEYLRDLINLPACKEILDTQPVLTQTEIQDKISKYTSDCLNPSPFGYDTVHFLPEKLVTTLLNNGLKVKYIKHVIDLLFFLPADNYNSIFQVLDIDYLCDLDSSGEYAQGLSVSQIKSFIQCVNSGVVKVWGSVDEQLSRFLVGYQNTDLLLDYLYKYDPKERLLLIESNRTYRFDFLQWILLGNRMDFQGLYHSNNRTNEAFFLVTLETLPGPLRVQALSAQCDSHTTFNIALDQDNPLFIADLIALLSEREYLSLLKRSDSRDNPPLYYVAHSCSDSTFMAVFNAIPEVDRLAALKMAVAEGGSVLDVIIDHKKFRLLCTVISALPEQDRLLIIKEKNLLFVVVSNGLEPNFLVEMLNYIPPNEQQAMICEPHSLYNGALLVNATSLSKHGNEYAKILLDKFTKTELLVELRGTVISNIISWHPREFIMKLLSDYSIEELCQLFSLDSQCQGNMLRAAVVHYDAEVLPSLLMLFPESQRLTLINKTNTNGDTFLYTVARKGNLDLIHRLLQLYPESQREGVMTQQHSNDGDTLLHIIAGRGDLSLVNQLQCYIHDDHRIEVLMTLNGSGETLLHIAARHGDSNFMVELIKLYPQDKIPGLLVACNAKGETVYHIAAEKAEAALLIVLLSYDTQLPKNDLLKMKTVNGSSIFHMAATNKCPEVLDFLLDRYPTAASEVVAGSEKDRLCSLGYTVLHMAVSNNAMTPKIIDKLLLLCPEARSMQTQSGDTPLHLAARRGNTAMVTHLIPKLLTDDELIQLVAQTNNNGETILHILCVLYNSFHILSYLLCRPAMKEGGYAVISMRDDLGRTVLHKALQRPHWHHYVHVLQCLTEDERLALFKIKDNEGYTVLSRLVNNKVIDKFFHILFPLSSSMKRDAVEASDVNGTPLLLIAIANTLYGIVEEILDLYPADQQLEKLQVRYRSNTTVLHVAAYHADLKLFRLLLAKYPDTERLPALRLKNSRDMTVLQVIKEEGNTAKLLDGILQLIPIENHAAVMEELVGQLSPTNLRHSIFGGHLLAAPDETICTDQCVA